MQFVDRLVELAQLSLNGSPAAIETTVFLEIDGEIAELVEVAAICAFQAWYSEESSPENTAERKEWYDVVARAGLHRAARTCRARDDRAAQTCHA